MFLIYFAFAVSDGVEAAFTGLKKKKKKPVSHSIFMLNVVFLFLLDNYISSEIVFHVSSFFGNNLKPDV